MKSEIYKDWQSGMAQKELENKYSLSNYELRQIIDQTPRERTCLACETVFVAVRQKKYCCRKCQPSYYRHNEKPNKARPKRKPKVTLENAVHDLAIKGMSYRDLQIAETLKIIGGAK